VRIPSIFNNDIAMFKNFKFGETRGVQLRWEVFNVFNVANLTYPAAITLAEEGTPASVISTSVHGPTARTTSVFGTGGPRAFQFAAKFRF